MNDFLQSIRNGSYSKDNMSKPRYNGANSQSQRPRRTYEPNGNGNYMRNNNNNTERKFRPRTGVEGYASEDNTMTTIKDTLQTILTNQEAAMLVAQRKAVAEERTAVALEFIALHIGKLSGETFVPKETIVPKTDQADVIANAPVCDVETETAIMECMDNNNDEQAVVEEPELIISVKKAETQSDMGKDDILNVIASMRREGSTYNEIASHLDELNLPTFSGRGKWHAQTIHRLCQTV